jgi:hypothetical protein
MAQGNIFQLMINDGVSDSFLYAYQKLVDRLNVLKQGKINDCISRMDTYYSDYTNQANNPDWSDERIAYYANKYSFCESEVDKIDMLSEIQKTHNIFIDNVYKPCAAMAFTYLKATEKEGNAGFGSTTTYKIPQAGIWVHDMVLHVRVTGLAVTTAPDKAKYAEWLGHRLMNNVEFKINEITLVNYGPEEYNNYYQFCVPPNKKAGWLRNIGQEQPSVGYLSPDPINNEFREYKTFGYGPQTLKSVQPDVDMWIPLIFWFNRDLRLAFPNGVIPYGSVKIAVTFGAISDLVATVDYGGGGNFTAPTISVADLYINHITTTPDLAQPVLDANKITMMRQTKHFESTVNQPNGQIQLKDLKFPVENLIVCFRPVENLQDADNWHRNVKLTENNIPTAVIVDNPHYAAQIAAGKTNAQQYISAINMTKYYAESDIIDSLNLTVSGVDLFPVNPLNLYTSYLPYTTPGVNTPDEQGLAFFNLALRPDLNDPSGHLNASKNREIYLNYTSSEIDDNNRAQLIVVAQAINFLIIKDQTVALRFL